MLRRYHLRSVPIAPLGLPGVGLSRDLRILVFYVRQDIGIKVKTMDPGSGAYRGDEKGLRFSVLI